MPDKEMQAWLQALPVPQELWTGKQQDQQEDADRLGNPATADVTTNMASVTFHGGVKDIGGNKFLVEDKGTKIFMDFGMSFSKEYKDMILCPSECDLSQSTSVCL